MVLGYGAYLVLQQQLTVGQLLVVVAYIGSVYKPLEAISGTIGALQDQLVNLQIAFDLLEKEPDIKDTPGRGGDRARARSRAVRPRVVSTTKGAPSTLTDICFEAVPGEAVAIVGATGAGKSTLVSLLPRFYDPQAGRILLDGRDIKTLTLRSLRRQISIVLQEPLLFSATHRRQHPLRPARRDDGRDRRGGQGGQRARLRHRRCRRATTRCSASAARSCRAASVSASRSPGRSSKNAPILILDEPTSSIDSKTEAVILDALDRLMVGRTTFIVAHRLSTLRSVSKILVLDQGRIVEQGTHDELLAHGRGVPAAPRRADRTGTAARGAAGRRCPPASM